MIPLSWYLIFAAALFSIGLYGVLSRKNAIAILMGIELMLNAVNVNLVAFWRYRTISLSALTPSSTPGYPSTLGQGIAGQVFAVIVFAVAAAEVAVGLALFISIYRRRSTVAADEINLLKW
jgi:NADH:ubiquinone oxidoreductase subunit K